MDKRPIFLKGEKVFLSPLEADEDLAHYLQWVNDQETTQYMEIGKRPTTKRQLQEYIEKFSASKDMLLGIFEMASCVHVGNITLQYVDFRNRSAEIGILIGCAGKRNNGYGSEAIRLVVNHAFTCYNLNKITAGMIKGNIGSQRIFEKSGFVLEGTLREHFFMNNKYYDCLRYGLLQKEWMSEK